MIDRSLLVPQRARRIQGSFAAIEHRFLRDGFLQSLSHHEMVLYLFLTLASDRNGISFYSYDKICTILDLTVDDYILARDALIEHDLLAFDGHRFQVLSLPGKPVLRHNKLLKTRHDMAQHDPATIHRNFCDFIGADPDHQLRPSRK